MSDYSQRIYHPDGTYTTYDNGVYGGDYGTFKDDAEGVPQRVGPGSGQRERDRYQGLGEAAAARKAYQADFSGANQDMLRWAAMRERQRQAAGLLGQSAAGNAPSRAAILGGRLGDQSLDAQMQAQANARAGSLASSAAAGQGMNAATAGSLAGIQHYGAMRGNELGSARGAFLGANTALRAQDYREQELLQKQAEAQAASENFQRQLNQQGQLGFEQRAFDVGQADLKAGLTREAIEAQSYEAEQRAHQADLDRKQQEYGAYASAGGTLLTSAGHNNSDVRSKHAVNPLSKYVTSDKRTKEEVFRAGMLTGRRMANGARRENEIEYGPSTEGLPTPDEFIPDTATLSSTAPADWLYDQVKGGRDQSGARGVAIVEPKYMARQAPRQLSKAGAMMPGGAVVVAKPEMVATPVQPGTAYALPQRVLTRVGQASDMADTQASLAANGTIDAADTLAGTEYGPPRPPPRGYEVVGASPGYDVRGKTPSDERTKTDVVDRSPMAAANRSLAPSSYKYKPEFTPPEQEQGETNVGPMAQNMAANPLSRTSVKRDPGTGMLMLDSNKLLKQTAGGVGYLQERQDETDANLARVAAELRKLRGAR